MLCERFKIATTINNPAIRFLLGEKKTNSADEILKRLVEIYEPNLTRDRKVK